MNEFIDGIAITVVATQDAVESDNFGKDCGSKDNTIHVVYNIGGLAGYIQRSNGLDNASVASCTVENITVDYYEECRDAQRGGEAKAASRAGGKEQGRKCGGA